MRLLEPVLGKGELRGEVRLPESDMADPADAKHGNELAALLLQVGDLGRIGRQHLPHREMALFRRHSQASQRAIEGLLHCILKGARVIRRQRIALGVGPFVHIEAVHVLTGDAPFPQEIDGPAVHPHRSNGQDQDKGSARLPGELDFAGDLVPHVRVEILVGCARDRLEVSMPPGFAAGELLRRSGRQAVDAGQVPARRQKSLHERARKGRDQIHGALARPPIFPVSVLSPSQYDRGNENVPGPQARAAGLHSTPSVVPFHYFYRISGRNEAC